MTELTRDRTPARLSDHGVDHVRLAATSRSWGALRVAERRYRAEVPFWHTFALTALGNPLAYLAAMGIGLGALVKADVGGVPYLTFVAPAMLVSTVATTGGGWGTWPVMSGFKWEKNYLAAGATVLSPQQIADGEAVALGVRLFLQGLAFWLIGFIFGSWTSVGAVLSIPAGVLAGLAFSQPLSAYAATIEDEGIQFNLIQRMVLMPMFLFAGTFFPLETMPIYLQWVGWISPMWHGTQLARVASYGHVEPAWLTALHLAFLLVLIVVGHVLTRRNFFRRMTK